MLHRWLADLVVVVHLLFVAFVAVGAFLALKWPSLVRLHVPAVIWAAAIVTIGFTCPLTPLEKYFRRQAGDTVYDGGFIDRYIRDVVYPGRFTNHARVIVAVTIIAGYVAMVSRSRRHGARRPTVSRRVAATGPGGIDNGEQGEPDR